MDGGGSSASMASTSARGGGSSAGSGAAGGCGGGIGCLPCFRRAASRCLWACASRNRSAASCGVGWSSGAEGPAGAAGSIRIASEVPWGWRYKAGAVGAPLTRSSAAFFALRDPVAVAMCPGTAARRNLSAMVAYGLPVLLVVAWKMLGVDAARASGGAWLEARTAGCVAVCAFAAAASDRGVGTR